ncbi:MAG: YicC family protein [Firmicutes bacterium]|nr:YicC family protein [Bacillota bacterium]
MRVIASMTGFKSGTVKAGDSLYLVDIRTLNHRFLDIHCRMPENLFHLEMPVRNLIKKHLKRGRVDIRVQPERLEGKGNIRLNQDVYQDYMTILDTIMAERKLESFDPVRLLTLPDMIGAGAQREADADQFCQGVEVLVQSLVADRLREGEYLWQDLLNTLANIETMTGELANLASVQKDTVAQRFRERIVRLDEQIDDVRVLTEIALLIDKSDINEELVRLREHIREFGAVQQTNEPKGRKLEFLGQEMLREVNTIASKSALYPISNLAVNIKSELEKIREQVQNIE